MYQIYFYVPKESAEQVKSAMFQEGAGRIGNYEQCAWQVEGVGQFKPMEGAHPSIGVAGALERVAEYRVEMVCEERYLKSVLQAMKSSHPYEEIAYGVYKIITLEEL